MAIVNIDNVEYAELYGKIDANIFIKAYQYYKYIFVWRFKKLVNKKAKILDIGCARGQSLHILKSIGYKNLYGIDLKCQLYSYIEHHVRFSEISITEKTSFDEQFFDAIMLSGVLHHIAPAKLDFVICEIYRICKQNGYVFIYEPNMGSLVGKLFYFYFLRLFPSLYKATMKEVHEQLEFLKIWEFFKSTAVNCFGKVLFSSEHLFYKNLVLQKKKR